MFGPFAFGFQDLNCGERRARWNWDFSGDMGGGPRGRGQWRGRAARLFEQGDLKYVILRLLEEKPRHGYEIIKDLEKDGRSSLGARTMLRLLEESRRILLERLGVQPEVKL